MFKSTGMPVPEVRLARAVMMHGKKKGNEVPCGTSLCFNQLSLSDVACDSLLAVWILASAKPTSLRPSLAHSLSVLCSWRPEGPMEAGKEDEGAALLGGIGRFLVASPRRFVGLCDVWRAVHVLQTCRCIRNVRISSHCTQPSVSKSGRCLVTGAEACDLMPPWAC